MNLDSITRDIAQAQIEFARLNRLHWSVRPVRGGTVAREYNSLKPATEKRIVELADTLRRLHGFRSRLAAKDLTGRDERATSDSLKQIGC